MRSKNSRWGNVLIYFILGVWAVIVLFPFYWMIITSMKSFASYNGEIVPKPYPADPTLENYVTAFTATPLVRHFLNTLLFTVVTTLLMIVVSVPAAFAFARFEFRGRNIAFIAVIAFMMIPGELMIITNYATIVGWNMQDSYPGLILPSVISILFIYLLKDNFESIPDEYYYAAQVDGASDFMYMCGFAVPMAKPTVIAIVILKCIECWNSYVWPRLITRDPQYFLLSNSIQQIRESGFGRENIPAMMAGVVVISAPLIVLFLVFRKQVMSGVAEGGLKQ